MNLLLLFFNLLAFDLTWVNEQVKEHPEIVWLANSDVRKTEQGVASSEKPFSEQLFGERYIEFDRTLMTLECLSLLLDGSDEAYEIFSGGQPKDLRLSKASFLELHDQGFQLLHSHWGNLSEQEMREAMIGALVLGDIGKSEKARELFKSYGTKAIDHDDFHEEALHILATHPQLCSTFEKLPEPAKNLLVKSANLVHYGHVTHLEGGPNMFKKMKESNLPGSDPLALAFDFFVHTCDVAGSLGHVNHQTALIYTEETHQAMKATGETVKLLSTKSEKEVYDHYIDQRASWLGLSKDDRLLARLGAMVRLFTPEDGVIIKKALLSLDPEMQKRIIAQLEREFARTPTYMPAVLVNLYNNPSLGSTKEERLFQTIQLGLPFLTKILENAKEDSTIPLNFNKVAGIAKTDPQRLQEEGFIDSEGMVILLSQSRSGLSN